MYISLNEFALCLAIPLKLNSYDLYVFCKAFNLEEFELLKYRGKYVYYFTLY